MPTARIRKTALWGFLLIGAIVGVFVATRESLTKWRQTAIACELASRATLLRQEQPWDLDTSVLLAIESMRRASGFEEDQALRSALEIKRRRLFRIEHNDIVNALAFSLDSRFVATASNDKTVQIYELASRSQVAILPHDGPVVAVAFS